MNDTQVTETDQLKIPPGNDEVPINNDAIKAMEEWVEKMEHLTPAERVELALRSLKERETNLSFT